MPYMSCRSSSNEIHAAILDRRGEMPAQILGRRDLEADRFRRTSSRSTCKITSVHDHALGRVEAHGVGELRCECMRGRARTAADIKEGVELAAGGKVVVDDSSVQVGVVAGTELGVVRTLGLGEGAEGLLGGDGDCWGWIRHGDGSW